MSPSDSRQPPLSAKERILLDPKIRKVHDYWISKRRGAQPPSRNDIDPVDLSDCLGVIMLLDIVSRGESQDFTVRLAGAEVEEAFGRAMKGRNLLELFEGFGDSDCVRRFRLAAITGEADFRSADLARVGRAFVHFDRALLPLTDGGGAITHLLCCYAFTRSATPAKPG